MFGLALSVAASDADTNTVQADEQLNSFLSRKFQKVLNPGGYEENFRRAVQFHDSRRFGFADGSEDLRQTTASGGFRSDSPSLGDTQAVLRLLQDVLLPTKTGPQLVSLARELTSTQGSQRSVADFETCAADVSTMMTARSNNTEWAVRMFDAWGKPGAGLIQSNLMFLGEYDQCLHTDVQGAGFDPQYCYQGVGLTKIGGTTLKVPFGFLLGTCVPSSCTADEVSALITIYLASQPNITGAAGQGQCIDPNPPLSDKAKAVIVVCSVFAALMLAASLYDILVAHRYWRVLFSPRARTDTMWLGDSGYDYCATRDGGDDQAHSLYEPLLNAKISQPEFEPNAAERALLCFSVYTNGAKVLSTSTGPGSIDCIHGIRFLSMSWVVLGHCFISGVQLTDHLQGYLEEAYKRWTFQAIMNALVSVDTFFALSGLLVTYLVMKELSKKPPSGTFFFNFYFHRFWRLTPPYMLVMMVNITLLHYMGDGPLWPQKSFEPDECRNNWWSNLLYINNLHNFGGGMCMGWSWYLANDMQFYIISPAIFLIMHYYGWFGVVLPFLLTVGSAIAAGVLSAKYDLQSNFDLLRPADGDYFNVYYVKPYCRIGPYLVGMITGYILYRTECKVYMSKMAVLVGWAFAWAVGLAVVYGLFENTNGHPLSTDVAALYNAMNRIAWGAAVCWVIFACATGYGGFINTLLSWKAFVPLSRLTYCTYLVHLLVIEYYFSSLRKQFYMDNTDVVVAFLGILVLSMMVAFAASMAFEAPFMGLEKLIVQGVKAVTRRVSSGRTGTSDQYRKF
ncbi:hypothetical protein EGW08_003375 [Elysia chlorotica]|uniref:Nose resistant-to-fluoxetine protein N-terminal domain-containing protein n=1 Tax=Elysia chlorotica TaxID=188477 RepID=A0A433U4W0_ELYCH|nr:hypothetical protein EGW08_003375 [Elysia chlorotica]